MRKQTFYGKKSAWKDKVKKVDKEMMQVLNLDIRGDLEMPLLDYMQMGRRIGKLGKEGEALAEKAVNYGVTERFVEDLRNTANHLEILSIRLKHIVETKWRKDLPHFPLYKCTMAATADIVEQSEAIQELMRMAEGGKDG
jgi:hypothetical protein